MWKDGLYNSTKLELGGFCASVSWWEGGYQVRFEHWTLKKKFPDRAEAMKAAEHLAHKKLTEALAILCEMTE